MSFIFFKSDTKKKITKIQNILELYYPKKSRSFDDKLNALYKKYFKVLKDRNPDLVLNCKSFLGKKIRLFNRKLKIRENQEAEQFLSNTLKSV
ncbi:MAG: hypothetical protein KDC90_17430 [Ignavibacteriae bacterium]|nr:hypothetical protein [Ignavibacteriota bacterium]